MNIFKNQPVSKSMPVNGNRVTYKEGDVDITKIKFWKDNPRIYSRIHSASEDDVINNKYISTRLHETGDLNSLRPQVLAHGGIQKPILVAFDEESQDYIVYDGNSRLACATLFHSRNTPDINGNSVDWQFIPAQVLDSADTAVINSLVGSVHLLGPNPWAPFEAAGWFYRTVEERIHSLGLGKESAMKNVADEFGTTLAQVRKAFSTVKFMLDNNMGPTQQEKQYGYWENYLSQRVGVRLRAFFNQKENLEGKIDNPQDKAFDKFMIDMVTHGKQTGEVPSLSADGDKSFRVIYKDICGPWAKEGNESIIISLLNGDYGLQEAAKVARSGGAGNHTYERALELSNWISDPETSRKLRSTIREFPQLKKVIQKIERGAGRALTDFKSIRRRRDKL
jgi:hypothetical protein